MDKRKKSNRIFVGTMNPNSKLTKKDTREIKLKHKKHERYREKIRKLRDQIKTLTAIRKRLSVNFMAKEYKVDKATIYRHTQ